MRAVSLILRQRALDGYGQLIGARSASRPACVSAQKLRHFRSRHSLYQLRDSFQVAIASTGELHGLQVLAV